MKISVASKSSPLIQPSALLGYEASMNPYVGDELGCIYDYAMQTVREPGYEWGEFVRIREHLPKKLPGELWKINGRSLLIGTMTEPYQPLESRYKLTHAAIEILKTSKATKIGIFTQSPTIVTDSKLIEQLPNASIHMTISPISETYRKILEPKSHDIISRLSALKKLKGFNIQLHVRIAPVFPYITDLEDDIGTLYAKLAEIGVDSIGVDPYQPFSETNRMIEKYLGHDGNAQKMLALMAFKPDRTAWWLNLKKEFKQLWKKYGNNEIYAYFADHVTYSMEDLKTGKVTKLATKSIPFSK